MTIVIPPLAKSSIPVIIGHRGSKATHPENTCVGFAHAFAAGAQAVELDVIPTTDGVLAVTHDFVTAGSQSICETRFAELSGIPRLEDVLRMPGGVFDIEIKTRQGMGIRRSEYAALVVRTIAEAAVPERVMVRSFDRKMLREVHRIAPHLPLAAITANPLVDWVRLAKRTHAGCISPHRRLVSPRRVRLAHGAGLFVMPWTGNQAATWERLAAAGVDGIITDDPAALARWLTSSRQGPAQRLNPFPAGL